MSVELGQVQAFMEIVRTGGFARASAELHLSQPAISRRIRLLENELGAPLFDRLGRSVLLTDAGRAFLPHARVLLASMQDGFEAVRAARDGSQGVVTLALVGTLASTKLTSLLRAHRDAQPELDLRLRTALSAEVSALVLRGEAGLGLRYQADPDPALTCIVIGQERLVPVCARGHPLAYAAPTEIAGKLAGQRWLAFAPQTDIPAEPYSTALHQLLAQYGPGTADIMPVDSLTAQKRMVEAGFGLAILPESGLEEEFRTGTVCRIPTTGPNTTIQVVLIRRRNAFTSGALRALITALTASQAQPSTDSADGVTG